MKYSRSGRLGVCCAALLLGGLVFATPPEGGYHLLRKHELGAAPGGKEYWDYIIFDALYSPSLHIAQHRSESRGRRQRRDRWQYP